MALANTLQKVAISLIKKFGRTATLHTFTEGAYDPDNGSTGTEADTEIKVFVGSYKAKDYNDFIRLGDAMLLTTNPLTIEDKITIGTKRYGVTLVEETPLNEEVIVYQANIRAV